MATPSRWMPLQRRWKRFALLSTFYLTGIPRQLDSRRSLTRWYLMRKYNTLDEKPVAGGHQTKAPGTITYASMVSRETVRLALIIVSLNNLEVKVGDVLNTYIIVPIKEKVWTVLGPEFGHDAGKSAIITRALYRLKSAGVAFWAHLASFMRQMGYTSCKVDPNLWLIAVTRPDNNVHYYIYILWYVDDILCINHDPMSVMNESTATSHWNPVWWATQTLTLSLSWNRLEYLMG